MKNHLKIILTVLVLAASLPALSNEPTRQLSECLTDSLNGKERKELAKWIFLAISSHSVISPYSSATEKDRDESNKFFGGLITRLMTEDCPNQTKLAINESGSLAVQNSFKVVGEVAMMELMSEQSVTQSISSFEKYLDQEKLNKVMQ